MRLLWLGTYERAYPRTRVLIEGLRQRGVEVVELHEPVWERIRHKAGGFLSPAPIAAAAGRWAAAWARLLPRALRATAPDAIVAGYPAQPDAVGAWLAARARGCPLVVDMMISLRDTLAGDRGRVSRVGALALAGVDRTAIRLADLVVADTRANAAFLAGSLGAPAHRLGVVPVGAEPARFPLRPPPSGPPHALFVGKLAPLHGVETVLAAARRPGAPPVRLIGSGQLDDWLARELRRARPEGLVHEPWVPYDELGSRVAGAAICLGIFGTSEKAGRVVPNKVWQAMAAGRPVITADTPGAREVLVDGDNAILVPPGDPVALGEALARLAADAALRHRIGAAARRTFERVGAPHAVAGELIAALRQVRAR